MFFAVFYFLFDSLTGWKIETDHYWPLTDSQQILGTRIGIPHGLLATGNNFMNRTFLKFDGIYSYIVIPNFKQTCVSVPDKCFYGITFSFLINLPSPPRSDTQLRYIIDIMGQNAHDAVGYMLYFLEGKVSVFIRSKYSSFHKKVAVPFNKWFHFTLTYSGQNGLKIYIDGKQM